MPVIAGTVGEEVPNRSCSLGLMQVLSEMWPQIRSGEWGSTLFSFWYLPLARHDQKLAKEIQVMLFGENKPGAQVRAGKDGE